MLLTFIWSAELFLSELHSHILTAVVSNKSLIQFPHLPGRPSESQSPFSVSKFLILLDDIMQERFLQSVISHLWFVDVISSI